MCPPHSSVDAGLKEVSPEAERALRDFGTRPRWGTGHGEEGASQDLSRRLRRQNLRIGGKLGPAGGRD